MPETPRYEESPPPPLEQNGRNMKGHNANGIFDIAMLTEFIYKTNTHSAECGYAMDLLVFDNSKGAHIHEIWQCPKCREEISLHSSKMVNTQVIEPGRCRSRPQPSINVRIAKASREQGVGIVDKTKGFLSESLGIKTSTRRNLRHTERKVRVAIANIKEQRQEENMKEHVMVTRSTEGYKGDIKCNINGEDCSISNGGGGMDGHGNTRSYGGKGYKGSQAAVVVTSAVTKKPIMMAKSQVSDTWFAFTY